MGGGGGGARRGFGRGQGYAGTPLRREGRVEADAYQRKSPVENERGRPNRNGDGGGAGGGAKRKTRVANGTPGPHRTEHAFGNVATHGIRSPGDRRPSARGVAGSVWPIVVVVVVSGRGDRKQRGMRYTPAETPLSMAFNRLPAEWRNEIFRSAKGTNDGSCSVRFFFLSIRETPTYAVRLP